MSAERFKGIAIVALIVGAIALGVSLVALRGFAGSKAPRRALVHQMQGLVAERDRLMKEVSGQPGGESGQDTLEIYLELIRKDGAAAHVPLRRTLSALSANQVSMLALADAYEPFARTPGYAGALRALRAYVLSWNLRWDGVFEVFMAGGNVGKQQAPFPDSFADALAAEGAESP